MLAYIAPGSLYAFGNADAIGVLALAATLMHLASLIVDVPVPRAAMREHGLASPTLLASMATLPHTPPIALRSARLAHTSHRSAALTVPACLPDVPRQ